jgi:hypothetical protein
MSQDIRSVLADAFTFVRSVESNKALAALTLDHLIQDYIDSIKQGSTTAIIDGQGNSVGSRISRFDQLSNLLTDMQNAVQSIQQAGDDPAKLQALGLFQSDFATVADTDPSTNAQSNAAGASSS